MMKKLLYISLFLGFSISVSAQKSQLDFEEKIVQHFKNQNWNDFVVTKDSLYKGTFGENNFNVSLSKNPIDFDTIHTVITNPYFSDKYESAEKERDYVKNFPKSFSVIYQNSLVSLFENGKFACFNLDNFNRNTSLENKLNTKKFKHHWVIDNQLGAISGNTIYIWNGNKWIKSKNPFPVTEQPILFEDNDFIVYRDCFGEWGGTVYFYEKSTQKTFFTESTCPNSIIKTQNGYQVLANLGHMFGSSEIKLIPDPSKLTEAKSHQLNKALNGQALGYADKSNAFTKEMELYGVQVFSTFLYQNRKLCIVNLAELTFIAEIKANKIEIVHPLYFNDLYTHAPITKSYGEFTLINLDNYGTGLKREISVLIISGNRIAKLDWNENHSR
ncbi:MAG: hypothetical protein LBM07_06245 [Culturomica sp.]|nr:hypothetical protein [Culturomica sp.]